MQPEIESTGTGFFHGRVTDNGETVSACLHFHREPILALNCAEKMARRLGWRSKYHRRKKGSGNVA